LFTSHKVLRVKLIHHSVGHALLVDLTVVDGLLHGVVSDQTVDVATPGLSVAVDPTDRLTVVARIPRRVKHHHTTRADQIDTETSGSAKNENKNIDRQRPKTIGKDQKRLKTTQ